MARRLPAFTPAELFQLPAALDLPTAARVLAIGESKARELVRTGEFPVPVIRIGANRVRVPKAELLRVLGIEADAA